MYYGLFTFHLVRQPNGDLREEMIACLNAFDGDDLIDAEKSLGYGFGDTDPEQVDWPDILRDEALEQREGAAAHGCNCGFIIAESDRSLAGTFDPTTLREDEILERIMPPAYD